MNQKLSDWASIAEIISGVAVVVTLIFLIVGIRENTSITRAAMFDSTLLGLAEFRSHVINNPEVADLWGAYMNLGYDDLDTTSKIRVSALVTLAFENQQRAYYARQYDVLGESEWSRFGRQICIQYPRVTSSEALTQYMQVVLTEEFWNFVVTTCESRDQ